MRHWQHSPLLLVVLLHLDFGNGGPTFHSPLSWRVIQDSIFAPDPTPSLVTNCDCPLASTEMREDLIYKIQSVPKLHL